VEKSNRNIILADEITQESVSAAVERITELADEDSHGYYTYGERYVTRPIHLYINTYGGEVLPGLALIGAIESVETPIITVALGCCYSMGLPIFLSGDERVSHRYARFMYHELSGFSWGKIEESKSALEEHENLQDILDKHILEKSKIPKTRLAEVRKVKEDWYFTPTKAMELGVVDAILGKDGKVTMSDELQKRVDKETGKVVAKKGKK
jgi:ATP-dependent Clp protease protease subunit